MTATPTERPTPAQKTAKSYKKGAKRGKRIGGWLMIFGAGVVGTFGGIGAEMRDIVTELLPEDDYEDEEEDAPAAAPSAPAAGQQVPPFLNQPSS